MGQNKRSEIAISFTHLTVKQLKRHTAKISSLFWLSWFDITHLTHRKEFDIKIAVNLEYHETWSMSEEIDKQENQPSTNNNSSKSIPTKPKKNWSDPPLSYFVVRVLP